MEVFKLLIQSLWFFFSILTPKHADFGKRGREGERRETSMQEISIGCLSYTPQSGTEPSTYLGMCTHWESNPRPWSVYRTMLQPTEPHQPELFIFLRIYLDVLFLLESASVVCVFLGKYSSNLTNLLSKNYL